MTDSDKLRLLANWFDYQSLEDENDEVQRDLRRIADNIEKLENKINYLMTNRGI